jgi:hypothetical protein
MRQILSINKFLYTYSAFRSLFLRIIYLFGGLFTINFTLNKRSISEVSCLKSFPILVALREKTIDKMGLTTQSNPFFTLLIKFQQLFRTAGFI